MYSAPRGPAETVIRVNRRDFAEWQDGMTVVCLLDRLRYTFPRIIVSINGEFVPGGEYSTRTIPDEADVRVIHLMAGG